MPLNICILGGGVVGLNTAHKILNKHRDCKVTIVADKYKENTLSCVAAGIFRPSSAFEAPSPELKSQWICESYKFYDEIFKSGHDDCGIFELSGYHLSNVSLKDTKQPDMQKVSPLYRDATDDELDGFRNEGVVWKYGSYFTTLVTDCSHYLPWLMSRLSERGVKFIDRTVNELLDLVQGEGKYDILINCSGYNAKYLCHDDKIIPIRGQVSKVRAPWIKEFCFADYRAYILPGVDLVTLGGTFDFGFSSTAVDIHDSKRIWEQCNSLMPSLKNAEIVRECAGLRPFRSPVRVEKEILKARDGRDQRVIHHYGHGGNGITMSPGSSDFVLELLEEFQHGNSRNRHADTSS